MNSKLEKTLLSLTDANIEQAFDSMETALPTPGSLAPVTQLLLKNKSCGTVVNMQIAMSLINGPAVEFAKALCIGMMLGLQIANAQNEQSSIDDFIKNLDPDHK